ncbi:hypothetical protein [Sphingomonas sp. Leaf17]|uniref:hypothetical protein n=1 Tax=Sphingomonas sp. Leaf17 TaxID=1735683 RepID=UPI0012E11951|nr:hypothetical protein [Sphingomonas sp. Leaf17]
MANVQTVGVGLYLALAVIQAVSVTGVSGLSRRVNTLLGAVTAKDMRIEIANVRSLSGEVSGLEIGFHDFNRRLLPILFALFAVSIAYFGYCTVWQNLPARQDGMWFIFGFYLVLPTAIFAACSAIIWWQCRKVAKRVKDAETRIRRTLVGLP